MRACVHKVGESAGVIASGRVPQVLADVVHRPFIYLISVPCAERGGVVLAMMIAPHVR